MRVIQINVAEGGGRRESIPGRGNSVRTLKREEVTHIAGLWETRVRAGG